MDLTEILSNPVRVRIIQYLQLYGDATTKQISGYLDDIPAPTIYRHVNSLIKEGVLTVKDERKVRGKTDRNRCRKMVRRCQFRHCWDSVSVPHVDICSIQRLLFIP